MIQTRTVRCDTTSQRCGSSGSRDSGVRRPSMWWMYPLLAGISTCVTFTSPFSRICPCRQQYPYPYSETGSSLKSWLTISHSYGSNGSKKIRLITSGVNAPITFRGDNSCGPYCLATNGLWYRPTVNVKSGIHVHLDHMKEERLNIERHFPTSISPSTIIGGRFPFSRRSWSLYVSHHVGGVRMCTVVKISPHDIWVLFL